MPDTRTCPFCAETIKAAAIKCRYCGSELSPVTALRSEDHGRFAPASAWDAVPLATGFRPALLPGEPLLNVLNGHSEGIPAAFFMSPRAIFAVRADMADNPAAVFFDEFFGFQTGRDTYGSLVALETEDQRLMVQGLDEAEAVGFVQRLDAHVATLTAEGLPLELTVVGATVERLLDDFAASPGWPDLSTYLADGSVPNLLCHDVAASWCSAMATSGPSFHLSQMVAFVAGIGRSASERGWMGDNLRRIIDDAPSDPRTVLAVSTLPRSPSTDQFRAILFSVVESGLLAADSEADHFSILIPEFANLLTGEFAGETRPWMGTKFSEFGEDFGRTVAASDPDDARGPIRSTESSSSPATALPPNGPALRKEKGLMARLDRAAGRLADRMSRTTANLEGFTERLDAKTEEMKRRDK